MSLELELETPTFYTWEVPGKSISIRLDFDVVDRILSEVMLGFGAVPRRGAEVGGLLLGAISGDDAPVVHIRDFEPVVSEHARGPSYLLSEADTERLAAALASAEQQRAAGREIGVVGFCRSHTRDGMGLEEVDLALFERYFPGPGQVLLLVKPFATRPCVGGFFFREPDGIRRESSYHEFPFRRKELGGDVAAPERVDLPPLAALSAASLAAEAGETDLPPPLETGPRLKRNVWIPLSFVFLLVGLVLGFQAAISLRPAARSATGREPYALALTAAKTGNTVKLRWDHQAPVILKARSGLLTITDGSYTKQLSLDPAQLRNESVIYHYLTGVVKFRLEVVTQDQTSVTENVEVHTGGASAR